MKVEHTIGVIIIILLAIDVWFAYQTYQMQMGGNQ